jgi:outer membrane immunogenic protein
VAPAFTWTGCYLGGHVGGAAGQKEWDNFTGKLGDLFGGTSVSLTSLQTIAVASGTASAVTLTLGGGTLLTTSLTTLSFKGPFTAVITFTGTTKTSTVTSISDDTHGFLAGGQVGCDYQFSPRWVIGVAGSGAWAHITGTFDMPFTALKSSALVSDGFGLVGGALVIDGTFPGGIVPGALLTAHSKTEWLADVTVRLGYVPWDRWLLYVKGGAAWAGDKYNVSGNFCSAVTLPSTCSTLLPFDFRGKETMFGWTTGVGAEYAFTDWATAFIEYDFYDFGTKHVTFTDQLGNLCSGGCVGGADINQRINVVKGGVNFRFNWGKYPAPIVARY